MKYLWIATEFIETVLEPLVTDISQDRHVLRMHRKRKKENKL